MAGIPYWIESLVFSFRDSIVQRVGADRVVYYHFPQQPLASWGSLASGFTPFTEAQRSFMREVFAYISSVVDLKFQETSTYLGFSTIVLANNDQGGTGTAGYMVGAPGDAAWGLFMSNVHSLSAAMADPKNNPSIINIYLHELGHVLGLKHPFGNTLPILSDAEDNFDLTLMTYGSRSPGISPPQGLQFQPLDVAALQYLYGPSKSAVNGRTDDTYPLSDSTTNIIWDGGGLDTLDATTARQRLELDLSPLNQGFLGAVRATLISNPGQITINSGTVIERVRGTAFDDVVFGNEADNVFWSNGGLDFFDGRGGQDLAALPGFYANSQVYLEGETVVLASGSGHLIRLRSVEAVQVGEERRSIEMLRLSDGVRSVPYVLPIALPPKVIDSEFTLSLVFNEPVTGLEAADFWVTGGRVTRLTGTGLAYTLTVLPEPGLTGALMLQLTAGSVRNSLGQANLTSQPAYVALDTAPISVAARPDAVSLINGNVALLFDEPFTLGSGQVSIQDLQGREIERLSATETSRVYIDPKIPQKLYLDFVGIVADGVSLQVIIPKGFIVDSSGNSVAYSLQTTANRSLTVLGTSGNDSRNLGPAPDVFDGLAGDDRIWGEEGNDHISGGDGNDRLNGMQGDDTLLGGRGNDTLIGHVGNDSLDGGDGLDIAEYTETLLSSATIVRVGEGYRVTTPTHGTDILINIERLQFADQSVNLAMVGNDKSVLALSRSGDAVTLINGNPGLVFDGFFSIGAGQIIIQTATGAEIERLDARNAKRVYADPREPKLYLDLATVVDEATVLRVSIPEGVIIALNGTSVAYSVLTSANRILKVIGTNGSDTRNLGPAPDIYDGLEGDDRIWGEEGNDHISGSDGNDRLNGMQGDDTLIGGAGNDSLMGHLGDDLLSGGAGNDTLDGGDGLDLATYDGARSGYKLVQSAGQWGLDCTDRSDGEDTLVGVERIRFKDAMTVLDLGPTESGGMAILLLGAVLGRESMMGKRALIGTAVELFDRGYTMLDLAAALMRLPIWGGVLTATNSSTDIATYLLTRVNGKAPTAAEVTAAVKSLESDVQGTFLANLASTATNIAQVDLVGLAKIGVEYPLGG